MAIASAVSPSAQAMGGAVRCLARPSQNLVADDVIEVEGQDDKDQPGPPVEEKCPPPFSRSS